MTPEKDYRAVAAAWLWTALAGLAGVLVIFRPGQAVTGVLLLLSAIAACPLSAFALEKRSGTKPRGGFQFALVSIFAALAGLGIAQNPATLKSWLPSRPAARPPVPRTLVDESGDFGNLTTKPFTPQGADWTLDWSFDCASLGDSGNFSVQVVRAGGGILAGLEKINDHDAGTEHYHEAGTFTLKVISECKWGVRAKG